MGDSKSSGKALAWSKAKPFGAEYADLEIGADRLRARGVAIGSDPVPHRLDYSLETNAEFITSRVEAAARGNGWDREVALERAESGVWSCESRMRGTLAGLPDPGGEMEQFSGALDPDLGLSPVFNTMPVLRHRLFEGGVAPELLMVWISVPDLALYQSVQLYSLNRSLADGNHLVHFEGPDPEGEDFVADIVFEPDGTVLDYPGVAARIR